MDSGVTNGQILSILLTPSKESVICIRLRHLRILSVLICANL